MLGKYDYNEALKVVSYMKSGKLATLDIERDPEGDGFIMQYTTREDYKDSPDKYAAIEKNYQRYLSKRIEALDFLNEFIEMQALDKVQVFFMHYDATSDNGITCATGRRYVGDRLTPDSSADDVERSLQRLEQELLNTGSQDVSINAYACKQNGKAKKYVQLTLIDLVSLIRENLR